MREEKGFCCIVNSSPLWSLYSLFVSVFSIVCLGSLYSSCLVIVAADTSFYLPSQKNEFEISGPVSQTKCSITELSEKMSDITTLSFSSKLI